MTPAADFAADTVRENGGKLVIVNLQSTPLDKLASIKIHAKCDEVMQMLMAELEIFVPPF